MLMYMTSLVSDLLWYATAACTTMNIDAQFYPYWWHCKLLRTCKPIYCAPTIAVLHWHQLPPLGLSCMQQPAVMCIWYEVTYLNFNYLNLHLFSPLNNDTHRIFLCTKWKVACFLLNCTVSLSQKFQLSEHSFPLTCSDKATSIHTL